MEYISCNNNGKNSYAKAFNGAIGGWNTSAVTTMESMFQAAEAFNRAIDGWNTSAVTTMKDMFYEAEAFNGAIDGWNTSAVTTMRFMFSGAEAFNGAFDGWDTSAVTIMAGMFYSASKFNKPIHSWNVSQVTTMRVMFFCADLFNGAIDGWDTSAVTTMEGMFNNVNRMYNNAGEFNQCLSTWAEKTPDDVITSNMFRRSACPDIKDPSPIAGPWCQNFGQGCFAPSQDPSQKPSQSPSDVPPQEPVEEEKESIDLYELRIVGEVGSGKKPVGQIMTLEPFFGFAYFEAHPSKLDSKNMHVELFAGAVKGKPCDSGVLL